MPLKINYKGKHLPYWLVVLIILLIGIGLLYIDEKFVNEDSTILSSIINKVATAVIITGLFSLLNKIILNKNLINLIHDKIRLKQGIDEVWGLIYSQILGISIFEIISKIVRKKSTFYMFTAKLGLQIMNKQL